MTIPRTTGRGARDGVPVLVRLSREEADALDALCAALGGLSRPAALRWAAAHVDVDALCADIRDATKPQTAPPREG